MSLDEILRVAKEYEIAFSTAGALVIAWIGYRLAKADSRRQEINAVSQPIFLNLATQLKCAKEGTYTQCGISDSEFHLLGQRLCIIERFFFNKALLQFKEAQDKCGKYDDNGRYNFHSPIILIRAIRKLQRYSKPR